MQVGYQISIGSQTHQAGDSSQLERLLVQAQMGAPVNHCQLRLVVSDSLRIQVNDSVSVTLSYNGEEAKVFSGEVRSVNWAVRQVEVYAESAMRKLLVQRSNRYFDKPKAGDMVSSLCGDAGVSTGTVETGLEFAFYALGDQHSGYEHLHRLALQCGFDLYADPDDKLQFRAFQGAKSHEFQYGVNILSARIEEPEDGISGVSVFGASPASHGQGADAASWFTKTTIKGDAGGSDQLLPVYDPTARNQNSAGEIAQAMLEAKESRKEGSIKVMGAPQVKLGDSAWISQMPLSSQNGTYKVMGIKHQLSLQKGFVTQLQLREN